MIINNSTHGLYTTGYYFIIINLFKLKRHKISGPIINIRYVFLALCILFLIFGTLLLFAYLIKGFRSSFDEAYPNFKPEPFFMAILFYVIYMAIKYKHIVEFDAQFLYVSINKTENKIDLRSINYIEKPILQWGNNLNNWVIEYCEEDGTKNKLRVNISYRKDAFDRFVNRVKKLNPKVIIKIY